MPISLVAGQNPSSAVTSTSITLTYASAPTQNNLLVACFMLGSGWSSQSGPSGWTKDAELQRGTGQWIQIWSKIAGASAPTGYTWSWTGSVTVHGIALEATGNKTTDYIDLSKTTDGGGSNVTTLTLASPGTLAQAEGLGVACIGLNGTADGWLNTWTNGFTEFANLARLDVSTKVTTSTTGTNTNQTWTTGRQAVGAIVHYKASNPDATPTPSTVAAPTSVPAPTSVASSTTVPPLVVATVTTMEPMGAEVTATSAPSTVATPSSVGSSATTTHPGTSVLTLSGVTLSVQFSPTTDPLDEPVWVEIASYIRNGDGIVIRRGRSTELDRFQAGTCEFTLNNRDLLFDPENTSGTFYGQLLPMRRVRVQATYNSVAHDLFTGFVLGWPQEYDPSDNDSVVPIRAVDAFEVLQSSDASNNFLILDDATLGRLDLNRLGGDDVTIIADDAGGHVRVALNIAGWPSGERSIADGINVMASGVLSGSVLAYCQLIEDSEDGFFFVAKDGAVTFLGRDARWTNTRMKNVQFRLADDGADVPYSQVALRYDRDYVINEATRTGSGEPQMAADSASVESFGRRRDEKTGLIANDAGLRAVAEYRVFRFKDPLVRPEPVRVPGRASPSEIPKVLGAELLDRVVLERRPLGGTVREFTGLVQSIEYVISQERLDATFTISPGDVDDTQYLILDDGSFGLLDTGVLAY